MNEQNIDINLIIQTFQEKVGQLTTDIVVKEATIKQLLAQLQQLKAEQEDFVAPKNLDKGSK